MARFVFVSGGGGGTGLVVVKEYDFTDCTSIDISAAGTHSVLKSDGATALATIITTHDASGGTIDGTKNIDVTSGSGIVVDVTSDSGGENAVLAIPLPTDLKDNFDAAYMMFEWIVSGVALTGTNNTLAKFKVSTSADMRGTPANGLVVIKSSAASGIDVKGEVQYNTGTTRTSADQAFSGGDLHIQLLMRRQSGVVYTGTSTSFAEPYTLGTSFGRGGRSFPASRPLAAGGAAPDWSAPHMCLMADCNTTSDRVEFTVKKFRICKFSPSVS